MNQVHFMDHPLQHRTTTPMDRFVYYLRERLAIHARRACGEPPPWTADPILRTYRFTNVKREWDRTTQWLLKHWYRPRPEHPHAGVACALARFFNYTPTLQALGYPYRVSWKDMRATLGVRRRAKERIFTQAYLVVGGTLKGESRIDSVLRFVRGPYHDGVLSKHYQDPWTLYERLRTYPGWGPFLSQEVILDCAYTAVLTADMRKFAVAGPGALRGLNRIHGRPVQQRQSLGSAYREMYELWQILQKDKVLARALQPLTVHDVEFNLCEFDKFERAFWHEGRPKQLYHPRSQ